MYLVDDAVPCEPCVVHDDVDLAVAEFGALLHQLSEVCVVQHVAWDGSRASALLRNGCGGLGRLAGIDVRYYHAGALFSEQTGCFGADTLPGAALCESVPAAPSTCVHTL